MHSRSALTYWQRTGYRRSDLQEVFTAAAEDHFLAYVSISRDVTVRCKKAPVNYLLEIERYFVELNRTYGVAGDYLICLHDGIKPSLPGHVPILAFGKPRRDYRTVLVPDPEFLRTRGYLDDLAIMARASSDYPWERKSPTAFWRGSSTGGGLTKTGFAQKSWIENPRIQLCLRSREIGRPDLVDAALSQIVQCSGGSELEQAIRELGILSSGIPFQKFVRYRYLLDIDGNSCSWSSLFRKLASDCVVLKIDSENEQWYYPRLTPWEHYLPVRADLRDLEDIVLWARAHDEECREIVINANSLIRSCGYRSELRRTADLLAALSDCERTSPLVERRIRPVSRHQIEVMRTEGEPAVKSFTFYRDRHPGAGKRVR